MKAAIVENGVVVNVILVDESTNLEEFGAILSEDARIGWLYDGETFTSPPSDPIVEPVPDEISDRQCFQQLAIMGLITQQEALTYLGNGTLPADFEAFVEALPEASQFDARMKLMANNFKRSDSWVEVFGQMQGMTPEQIDQLWRDAAAL